MAAVAATAAPMPCGCAADAAKAGADDGLGGGEGVFECNVCLELAKEPVVTLCGHLFCWPCLWRWMQVSNSARACPVCKAAVDVDKVIPIYGRGNDFVPSASDTGAAEEDVGEDEEEAAGARGTAAAAAAGPGSCGGKAAPSSGGRGGGGSNNGDSDGGGSGSGGSDVARGDNQARDTNDGTNNGSGGGRGGPGGGGAAAGAAAGAARAAASVPPRPSGQRTALEVVPAPAGGPGAGTHPNHHHHHHALVPALFGFQFGGGHHGHGPGGASYIEALTPEQQHQAFLSRLLLMLGSFVIMCLLLF